MLRKHLNTSIAMCIIMSTTPHQIDAELVPELKRRSSVDALPS